MLAVPINCVPIGLISECVLARGGACLQTLARALVIHHDFYHCFGLSRIEGKEAILMLSVKSPILHE